MKIAICTHSFIIIRPSKLHSCGLNVMFDGEKAKVLTRPRTEPVNSLGLMPKVRKKSGNLKKNKKPLAPQISYIYP